MVSVAHQLNHLLIKGFFCCLLRNYKLSEAITKVSGKKCSLKDGEGLQVTCKLYLTAQKNYLELLKRELQK